MRGYELTGRGKFLITVVLLIIMALPLFVWGSLRNTKPDDSLHNQSDTHQTEADPTPSGSEQGPETASNGEQGSQNGSNSDPDDPSTTNQAVFDIDAGVLTFQFTPASQTTFDYSTLSMIGELVASPMYTADTVFAVEIPHLPDEDDAVTLTTAIIEAFTSLDVPLGDIVFFVYQAESDAVTFDIKISLIRQE